MSVYGVTDCVPLSTVLQKNIGEASLLQTEFSQLSLQMLQGVFLQQYGEQDIFQGISIPVSNLCYYNCSSSITILYLILPTHHQLSHLFEILALWDIWNMKKETLTAKIVSLILLSSLVPFLWTKDLEQFSTP